MVSVFYKQQRRNFDYRSSLDCADDYVNRICAMKKKTTMQNNKAGRFVAGEATVGIRRPSIAFWIKLIHLILYRNR